MVKGDKNKKIDIEEELSDVSSESVQKPSKKVTATRKKSAEKEAEVEVIATKKGKATAKVEAPKKTYSDDSDSSEDKNYLKKKQPRKTSKASKKSSKKAASSDSESEKAVKPKKTPAKKAASSDSDSEEKKPKKISTKKKAPSSDSDSESEKPKKVTNKKKAPSSDSESEKPKKVSAKKKAPSSDSESEKPKKVANKKKAPSSDSESEKPVVKSVAKTIKKKEESSDSDSEVQVEKKNSQESAKPTKQAEQTFSTPSKNGSAEQGNELYVKGLSFNTTEEGLKEYLAFFGEIIKVRVIRDRETQQPRGIAFVEFANPADAQKAAAYTEDLYLDGRSFKVEVSKGGSKTPASGNRGNVNEYKAPSYDGPKFTIFCGNLGFKTTPQAIEKFFGDAKPVDIRIALQEDGRRKGFAHIDFKSEEDRKKALTKNGKELDGRELKLDESQSKGSGPGDRQGGNNRRPPLSDFDRAKKAGGIVSATSKALKIADSDSD